MSKIIGSEGNAARRHFWEMCASRKPPVVDQEGYKEDTEDVAKWADLMVEQWEKRWTVEEVLT